MSLIIEATNTDTGFFASLEMGFDKDYGYQYELDVVGERTFHSLYFNTESEAWLAGVKHLRECEARHDQQIRDQRQDDFELTNEMPILHGGLI